MQCDLKILHITLQPWHRGPRSCAEGIICTSPRQLHSMFNVSWHLSYPPASFYWFHYLLFNIGIFLNWILHESGGIWCFPQGCRLNFGCGRLFCWVVWTLQEDQTNICGMLVMYIKKLRLVFTCRSIKDSWVQAQSWRLFRTAIHWHCLSRVSASCFNIRESKDRSCSNVGQILSLTPP